MLEILKLRNLLNDNKIEYEYRERNILIKMNGCDKIRQITIFQNGKTIISVIQGFGTYGNKENQLEIMGFLIKEEELRYDGVVGYLTAENVLDGILNYFKEQK